MQLNIDAYVKKYEPGVLKEPLYEAAKAIAEARQLSYYVGNSTDDRYTFAQSLAIETIPLIAAFDLRRYLELAIIYLDRRGTQNVAMVILPLSPVS